MSKREKKPIAVVRHFSANNRNTPSRSNKLLVETNEKKFQIMFKLSEYCARNASTNTNEIQVETAAHRELWLTVECLYQDSFTFTFRFKRTTFCNAHAPIQYLRTIPDRDLCQNTPCQLRIPYFYRWSPSMFSENSRDSWTAFTNGPIIRLVLPVECLFKKKITASESAHRNGWPLFVSWLCFGRPAISRS